MGSLRKYIAAIWGSADISLEEDQVRFSWQLLKLPLRETVVLVVIVVLAFLLRLAAYDHPLGYHGGDGYGNYMVADHALRYGQWPLTGPHNSFSPTVGNSPFYYYLIIGFAKAVNTPQFVGLCFILLQCLSIVGLFYATRLAFGRMPAFLAAMLVGFSTTFVFDAAGFIWQPYVMEPFLIGSMFLFALGYRSKNLTPLLISQIVALLALALHLSVLAFLPLYLCALYYLVWKRGGVRSVVLFATTGIFTILILFGSTLAVSYIKAPDSISSSEIAAISFESLDYFFTIATYRAYAPYAGISAFFLFVFLSLLYLLIPKITRDQKRALLFAICCIIQQMLFMFVFDPERNYRYFVPITWALVAATSAVVYGVFLEPRRLPLRFVGSVLLGILAYSLIATPEMGSVLRNIPDFERPRQASLDEATDAVVGEIERIKLKDGFDDYRFFSFYGLRTGNHYVTETIFWQPLEGRLGLPLMTTTWVGLGGYAPLNRQDYLFLFCTKKDAQSTPYSEESCISTFKNERSGFTILGDVYRSEYLSVFLTKGRK